MKAKIGDKIEVLAGPAKGESATVVGIDRPVSQPSGLGVLYMKDDKSGHLFHVLEVAAYVAESTGEMMIFSHE